MNIIVIDTETINLQKAFIYDIGFIVASGEELKNIEEKSFIIRQAFDNKMLFETSYYSKKLPIYTKMLKSRNSKRKYFGHSIQYLKKTIQRNNITKIFAYNSSFDERAFKFNIDYFKTQNVFENIEFVDILTIANNFIHNSQEYKKYCKLNNFITEKGNCKTNAEITYKFISGDLDFEERHTGLEDCKIELEILKYCVKLGYDFNTIYKRKFIKCDIK